MLSAIVRNLQESGTFQSKERSKEGSIGKRGEGRNGKTATPLQSGCASLKETLDSPSMRISLESLSKRYGRVHALDNVNLTLESGQIVAVLGMNGAGKTTFLRCLC